jgi:hypothetical protein
VHYNAYGRGVLKGKCIIVQFLAAGNLQVEVAGVMTLIPDGISFGGLCSSRATGTW